MDSSFDSQAASVGESTQRRQSSSECIQTVRESSSQAIGQQGSPSGTSISSLENGLSNISLDAENEWDGEEYLEEVKEFDPSQCLFCNAISEGFNENLGHMRERHGLFIPDTSHLIVDLNTIVGYLHLVIFGYSECLYCGSQRSSPAAAQQHMIGKGHCKIDTASEESEFRDFYDFDTGFEKSDGENSPGKSSRKAVTMVDPKDNFVRLASGKILSHRSAANPHTHKHRNRPSPPNLTNEALLQHDPEEVTPESSSSSASVIRSHAEAGALTRSAKRERVFEKQLASLRTEDRRSLMHLTVPQQRALLTKAKKQVERARKEENEMQLKIQLQANKSNKK